MNATQKPSSILPLPGEIWRHHSGRLYTVTGLANMESEKTEYQPTVVYIGTNGKLWTKSVGRFLETMTGPCKG